MSAPAEKKLPSPVMIIAFTSLLFKQSRTALAIIGIDSLENDALADAPVSFTIVIPSPASVVSTVILTPQSLMFTLFTLV